MDKLSHYRRVCEEILREYVSVKSSQRIERDVIVDRDGNHFQYLVSGWEGSRRTYGLVIHLAIRNGKVWVEFDGTEADVAKLLLKAGVPREDIVLGFQAPFVRPMTEFTTVE